MRTLVVELGTGADLHGGDATTAAVRAVQDCFNHVSLPGLFVVAGLRDPSQVEIEVVLGVPEGLAPLDLARVSTVFPFGRVKIKVERGGLRVEDAAGRQDDFITVVNAALLVRVP